MDRNEENTKDALSTPRADTMEESALSPRDDESLPMSFMITDLSTPKPEDGTEKQQNQARGKQDEIFTDKDRAAAVVIGTKDIKAFLEHKKFVDQRRKHPEDHSASLFFNQAEFLMCQNKWAPALELINKALCLQADNKKWLVERARCYAQLSQMDHALNDVEDVLKLDRDYFPAICQKGEIMYALWDLEHALLYFHRGLQLRPGNVACTLGVRKARTALEAELTENIETKKKKKKKKGGKKRKGKKSTTPKSFHSEIPSRSTFRFSSSISSSSKIQVDSSFEGNGSQKSGKEISKEIAIESGFSDRSVSRSTVLNTPSGSKQLKVNRKKKESTKVHGHGRDSNGIDRLSPSISDRFSPSVSGRSSNSRDRNNSRSRNSYSSRSKSPRSRRKRSGSECSTSSEIDFRFSRSSSASTLKICQQMSCDLKQIRREIASEVIKNQQASMSKKLKKKRKKKSVIPDKPNKLDQRETFDLTADQRFLESVLNNKDLKQGKSESIKKAFHMIREVYSFVSERQKYWDAETMNGYGKILEIQQSSPVA